MRLGWRHGRWLWATGLAIGLGACVDARAAEPIWFTVMGNAADPHVNTIEVDPVPVDPTPEARVMTIRVNRSTERRNWEGVPYRSYVARVRFDCRVGDAVYLYGEFYGQPLWKGETRVKTDYSKLPPRKMLFLDVEPNPTKRIVRAACSRE